jgi:hypothetical protein
VGAEQVRWNKEDTARAGDYTFLYGKGNENYHWEQDFSYTRE